MVYIFCIDQAAAAAAVADLRQWRVPIEMVPCRWLSAIGQQKQYLRNVIGLHQTATPGHRMTRCIRQCSTHLLFRQERGGRRKGAAGK